MLTKYNCQYSHLIDKQGLMVDEFTSYAYLYLHICGYTDNVNPVSAVPEARTEKVPGLFRLPGDRFKTFLTTFLFDSHQGPIPIP